MDGSAGDYQNPRGGGRGRGIHRSSNNQSTQGAVPNPWRGGYHNQGRGRGGTGRGRGYQNQSNQGGNERIQNQQNLGVDGTGRGGRGRANQGTSFNRGSQNQQHWGTRQPPHQGFAASTGRPWGPSSSTSTVQTPPPNPSPDELASKISGQLNISSSLEKDDKLGQPIKRPDHGGKLAIRSIRLLVNHFPVKFDPHTTIIHYDVDIKPVPSDDNKIVKKAIRKSDMRSIRDKLFSDDPRFSLLHTAYDGEKNIFSALRLPTGQFRVDISEGEDAKAGSYTFTIKYVKELKLSNLRDYLRGNLSYIPRDVLQGMDLVMKENPSRRRIRIGQGFYSYDYQKEDDLHCGIAAYRGFHSSLKPTSQGLALCLDFSTLALRKPLKVIEFLMEHVPGFKGVNDIKRLKIQVENALIGSKVRVLHRVTKQKYTILGLADEDTRHTSFLLVDPEGVNPPRDIRLVEYFKEKWKTDIMHLDIPCLKLGKNNNLVPMEFCVVVEGQRYPKEHLDKNSALLLKNLTLVKPWVRQNMINEMVQAEDGPCSDISKNFKIEVDANMTAVLGRVIGPPELKIGTSRSMRVDPVKCQWNLVGHPVVDGKTIEHWALLDFTGGERKNVLWVDEFVDKLRDRSTKLGIRMEEPFFYKNARMSDLSYVNKLEELFRRVMEESSKAKRGKPQIIVCAMARKDKGYKLLKWVSETRVGVQTQCFLSPLPSKGQDQYLANLCLKINAKLGGSNFELIKKLPHFEVEDHVMFIGADVNHPGPSNTSCPSIAAVVATVNWPAANRYAAKVIPQVHRKEDILNFGEICSDLVNTYARFNKVKPNKIVIFRDGVSEGQFEMVLGKELLDLKKAFCDAHYQPRITVIVAQKRHHTRLFVENGVNVGPSGNVPPGTVVDTTIVHPFDFDFYLASHFGGIGTSKPTHYYVLWDENLFTSDTLQKLIYDLCFTFARCTKPVSLVPPVYYADLVAYRGRLYQEALMESQPRQSAPFSRGSPSSSSSATASFDPSFYNLHSDLENNMFFV